MELEGKGIDKKCLYVHNTSYYDTKIHKVQSALCLFLFITVSMEE